MLFNLKHWLNKDTTKICSITLHKNKEEINFGKKDLKLLFLFTCFVFATQMLSEIFIVPKLKQLDLDYQKSEMIQRADSGQDYAALWLVNNYKEEADKRLPSLMDKGYPEALSLKGFMLIHDGNKNEGLKYLNDAANKGYKPAMDYITWTNR